MKKVVIIVFVSIIVMQFIGFLNSGGRYTFVTAALTNFFGSVFYFIIGIFLLLFNNTKEFGKGLLISSGIMMIIGLSVCGASMSLMH